ncbi:MAG: rRNA maturation RNase YbeY [Patescibacteria group bacterium]
MNLDLVIHNKTKFGVPKKVFLNLLGKISPPNRRASGQVSLVLVGEKEIKKLNALYRKKNAATDVLSFPVKEGENIPGGGRGDLGDVFICPAVVKKIFGRDSAARIEHLFVHGVLHLLGYDHDSARAAQKMEKLEGKILNSSDKVESPRRSRDKFPPPSGGAPL